MEYTEVFTNFPKSTIRGVREDNAFIGQLSMAKCLEPNKFDKDLEDKINQWCQLKVEQYHRFMTRNINDMSNLEFCVFCQTVSRIYGYMK